MIEEGEIKAILPNEESDAKIKSGECTQLQYARYALVMPGFVNAHMHQYGMLSHGLAADVENLSLIHICLHFVPDEDIEYANLSLDILLQSLRLRNVTVRFHQLDKACFLYTSCIGYGDGPGCLSGVLP